MALLAFLVHVHVYVYSSCGYSSFRTVITCTLSFLNLIMRSQSQLSDVSPSEDFSTSLGVDQSIRITCQPIATVHNTRSGLLGGSKTNLITHTHTFQVKNTRADQVHIKLLEQLPLSTDDRIKVGYLSPSLSLSLSLSFSFF